MQAEGSAAPGSTAVRPTGSFHPDKSSQVFTRLPRAAPPTVDPTPRIVIVRSAEELALHRAALDDLAANALEPNVFYEPILADAAVRSLGAGRRLELVLVYRVDPGAPGRPPELLAFFPFERVPRYRGVPVTALVSFQHVHCFLCTPLVRRQGAHEAVAAVADWLIAESGVPLVELRSIAADGPVHQLLLQELDARRRTFWLADWSTRALFEPSHDAEAYLRDAISGLALKEVRRKERRLAEQGRLVWRELAPGEDARPWLEDFLRLEASGWKGREGSAIACAVPEREFFLAAASAAHARNRLMLLGLFLDDRPVALKCNFLCGDGGFAFKIAFDEAYRAFSPGFLLEVENVRRLHRRADLRWMDSCAASQHAMINRLWPGRRTMATVLFSTGRGPGDLLVALMPLFRWGLRKLTRRRADAATSEGSPA
jgi:CelD/BcsL family acetyltransferase involved in cellulose biosynthesis